MVQCIDIRVTWGDTDAGGLIYFPRFFHFFVVALNDYFQPVFPHLMEELRNTKRVLPAVETSASFASPLRAGDIATVETEVKAGDSSLTAKFTVIQKSSGEKAAEGMTVFVLVNDEFEPVPLPDELLDHVAAKAGS